MPYRKELSEDLRSRIVDLHEAGKGYKSISKSLDVHVSTVRQTVYKWRKFSTVATLLMSWKVTPFSVLNINNYKSWVKRSDDETWLQM